MLSLSEFGTEIQKIREAVTELTIKGAKNANLIVYIVNKCNGLIGSINEAMKILNQQKNPPEDQNSIEAQMEEGELYGEPDSGTAS